MKNAHERFGKLVYRRQTERQPPTFEFSWMPLWEKTKGKPTWSRWLAATWRSARWLQHLPTETHSPWVDPYGEESIVSLGEKPLMLPRLHRGSWTEAAAEASCELLAGVGGYHLRWETAPD